MRSLVDHSDKPASEVPPCSFCGRTKDDPVILLLGRDAAICQRCVLLAVEILGEEWTRRLQQADGKEPTNG